MRIGPWMADALLGAGATGHVYRVVHDEDEARTPFALKVLTHSDAEVRRRLLREAHIGAGLRHPNLVSTHELMEHDGTLALRMSYVAGPTLAALVGAAVVPVEVLDAVAADVLAGVAAAHAAGVVHRDLKPANVLLAPTDDGLRARVADLGLARPSEPVDSLRTRPGWAPGTPAYMAPEQLRGQVATPRSDVFALGVLLYEVACGVRPFVAEDHIELVDRIASGRHTPVEQVRPGLPPRIVDALRSALSADPEQRPADAAALREKWAPEPARWPPGLRAEVLRHHRPTPVAVERAHNLPTQAAAFVGRTDLRAQASQAVRQHRLVTLTGIGGVGKSRLAAEVGRQVLDGFPGGVWWVDCTTARSGEGVASAVCRVLGATGPDPFAAATEALRRRGRVLLVLDNLEQVVEHAPHTIGRWLDDAPRANVLGTSRIPLGLADERRIAVDVLGVDTAVALFAERARLRRPDFDVADDNREAVRSLVARLDGLPLAIEIAAARVRDRSLGRLLARLDDKLQALPRRDSTSSAHQRTLRATLDWSWDLLGPDERTTLVRLSVFEGGAEHAAVEAVVDLPAARVQAALTALDEHSLVRRQDGRLGLLETVRAWAGGRLRALGDEPDAVQRHVDWFEGYTDRDWLFDSGVRATFVVDEHNLEAATRRAVAAGDAEQAWRCLSGLWVAWTDRVRGPARELALKVVALDGLSAEGATRMWHIAGMACDYTDRHDEAAAHLERGIEVARRVGLESQARNLLGSLVNNLVSHEPDRAEALAVELADACRRAGDHHRLVEALGHLGALALRRGEVPRARDLLQQVCSERDGARLPHGADHAVGMLGIAHATLGELDEAERRLHQACDLAREQGSMAGLAGWVHNLGWLLFERGRPEEALRELRQAVALYETVERPFAVADARAKIGMVLLGIGGPEAAEPPLRAGVAGLRDAFRPSALSVALCDLGRVRAMAGDLDEARVLWAEALALCERVHARTEAVRVQLAQAEWEARSGSSATADTRYADALEGLHATGLAPSSWLAREARRMARHVSRCGEAAS